MPVRANSKLVVNTDILSEDLKAGTLTEKTLKKAVKIDSDMFGLVGLDEWISSVEEFLLREGDGSVY